MPFFKESELKSKFPFEGIKFKAAYGKNAMITIFDIDPNSVVPKHKHPHEQISYVIQGAVEFTLEGETRLLKEGEGVVILPNQEHGAKALFKPVKILDAWNPIREEYR